MAISGAPLLLPMPLLTQVLSIVFPVFSIIAIGYIFARFKKIDLEPVIDILLYLTIPALVLSSLSHKAILLTDLVSISIAACAVVLGVGAISRVYLKIVGVEGSGSFYLPVMFMNAGNIPFPLALLAFGVDGLQAAVLYYIATSVLVYTLGIYMAKGPGGGGLGEIFRLPLIYSAAIGIGLNLAGVDLSGPILTTLDMLGAATIPLMQLSLGYYLYRTSLKDLRLTLAGSLIRILGGLAVAYAIVTLLGIEGVSRKVVLLSSAMPSAVITFVMSYKYDLDSDLVASIVATSTIISILTIPILLAWIM